MESNIFSLKDIKNKKVTNPAGDSLGNIDEVVLDLQTGQIAYLLLASGGFLGIGEKYLPVPPEALRYNPKAGGYQMDIPKDRLKNAPHIEMKDWPNRPDKRYVDDLYSYYGYKPYYGSRK
jgi:sporulation protein YlmC with PRC-barrel domain